MERLCLVIYETSETGKKALHDSLAAYSIAKNVELIIKWLKPSTKEEEIVSACTEAQIAFVLKQAEDGTSVGEVCRKTGISEATFYAWRKKFVGLMPA